MPRNHNIKKVLVIGSGPIVIGQAAEFDYAGTQACRSLKEEGVEVVLVNSNPATIMTDKEIADEVYIEPLSASVLEEIIRKEKPDSILPTLGGQAGLNLGMELEESGFLKGQGVKLIGTTAETIFKAEDRQAFKDTMEKIGEPCAASCVVKNIEEEIENVKSLGVKIETNVVVGKSVTIDQLIQEEGFEAVFIGSGAGLPKFMGIPGENSNGVFSANEYLTRSNLMKAFDGNSNTPIMHSRKVAVVGGGNVAMDAARTALRLGAEVHIVYRRSEEALPARVEEVHHAKEEGIIFDLLTNPTEILADEKGWVTGMKCIRMELGEPDASGRRRPVEIPDSEFTMELDTVIMSLGTSPNPLISSTTEGLETNKWKCIVAEEANGQTSKAGVYAGGDAVTGAATVILAMGAGKAAAKGIDEYLRG